MKKILAILLVSFFLIASIIFVEMNLLKLTYNKNKQESEEILKIAYEVVADKGTFNKSNNALDAKSFSGLKNNNAIDKILRVIEHTDISNYCLDNNQGVVGVLVIPKLQIEAPILDGTSQKVMKNAVGHFVESDYWEGNVSLASHNSGTNAHYFERINTLEADDEIDYITKLGTKKYAVQSIQQINSTDWSMVVKNNHQSGEKENTITLITCINGNPNIRLCVRGVEM